MVVAKSASDKTDDWPYWMVWDGTRNVTSNVAPALGVKWRPGAVFSDRATCEKLAKMWNEGCGQTPKDMG